MIRPEDPLFGTWINELYQRPGSPYFAKKVLLPDGRELDFDFIADAAPARESLLEIEKMWTDADGSHWYHLHTIGRQRVGQESEVERFFLSRISVQGAVLEQLSAKYDYPTCLDPTDVNYTVLYKD